MWPDEVVIRGCSSQPGVRRPTVGPLRVAGRDARRWPRVQSVAVGFEERHRSGGHGHGCGIISRMQRFVRPGFLAPVGDRLWIVDQFWPVAAVLDPVAGEIVRLVSYSELPPPLPSFARWFFGWRALGTSAGLWIQPYPTAPVALINESGLVHANYSSGTRLQVATAAGAWCAAYLPEVSTPPPSMRGGGGPGKRRNCCTFDRQRGGHPSISAGGRRIVGGEMGV